MARFVQSLAFLMLAACAQFPQLEGAISDQARQSAYPGLEPVDELLARAQDPTSRDTAAEIADMQNRARLLRARAQALRQTAVIDADAQARMKAAYNRLTQ
ncbi:MAG: hypothetical protein WBN04_05160 [Paracoccaceae bacterium]